MVKKIVTKVIVWLVQAVDINIEKEGENLKVEVQLYGTTIISKTIPVRRT